MADTPKQPDAKKADKSRKGNQAPPAEKGQKGEKGEKGEKAAKAAKATQAAKPETGEGKAPKAPQERVTARLRKHFDEVVRKALVDQFGYKNPMQVPVLDKVVLNIGVGEGVADRKKVDSAAADLALIAGQKAVITKSRKAISNFKLRENQPIGC